MKPKTLRKYVLTFLFLKKLRFLTSQFLFLWWSSFKGSAVIKQVELEIVICVFQSPEERGLIIQVLESAYRFTLGSIGGGKLISCV